MKIKNINLDLPAPPHDWDDLTSEQLEHIHQIARYTKNTEEYKMLVLFYLCGLEIVGFDEEPDEDDHMAMQAIYIVRRIGKKHRNERTEIRAYEVVWWIDKFMKFLDNPFELYGNPYPNGLKIEGKWFKTPDSVLSNLTYQQYGEVQRAMADYWDYKEQLHDCWDELEAAYKQQDQYAEDYSVVKRKDPDKNLPARIKKAQEGVDLAQATFLANLLTPRKKVWFRKLRQWFGEDVPNQYPYSIDMVEQLIPLMRNVKEETFQVLYQQVQSALSYYRKSFPDIFKSSTKKDEDGRDQLVIECDTVEAVKKYANYPLAQDVYDENAVLIFSVLNTMAKEAKMLKEQEKKINSRK